MSCWAADACAASDSGGTVTRWNGAGWGEPTSVLPSDLPLSYISCVSAVRCVLAKGGTGMASAFAGTQWGPPVVVVAPHEGFSALSCPTATFCVAVNFQGKAYTFDGMRWSAATSIGLQAITVSCGSTTMCVAAGDSRVAVYDGTSWHPPIEVEHAAPGRPYRQITSVSCPNANFCLAADYRGMVVTYSGGRWQAPLLVNRYDNAIDAVTCRSSTFCVALAYNHALYFDGTTWTDPVAMTPAPPAVDYLQSISCGSPTSCVAVGGAYAVTGNPTG